MNRKILFSLSSLLAVAAIVVLTILVIGQNPADAQELTLTGPIETQATISTSFSYQGRLRDGSSPANGFYDFEFKLYDDAMAGSQVGSTVSKGDVTVTDGLFTVFLDFGSNAFQGDTRYLEIGVRPGNSVGVYTTLTPRQVLAPVPYALYAKNSSASEFWRIGKSRLEKPLGMFESAGVIGGDTDRNSLEDRIVFVTADDDFSKPPPYPMIPRPTQYFSFFPAPATTRTVQSAKFYMESKTGDYPHPITLTLRIYDYDKNLKRTVSAVVDLRTAAIAQWTALPLSTNSADLVITPGEFLAFEIPTDGVSISEFVAWLYFEVEVR